MKDIFMLAGFSLGLITGAMLYKYSNCAQKLVDKGEKAVVKEAEMLEQKAEKGMEELGKKMKKNSKKAKQSN